MKQSNHIIEYFKTNDFNLYSICNNPIKQLTKLSNHIEYLQTFHYHEYDPDIPTHKTNVLTHPYLMNTIKKRDLLINHFMEFIRLINITMISDDMNYIEFFEYINTAITHQRITTIFDQTLFNNISIYNTPIIKKQFTNTYYSNQLYNNISFIDLSEVEVIILILYYINSTIEILIDKVINFRDNIFLTIQY